MFKIFILIIFSKALWANTTIINENPLQITQSAFLQNSAQVGAEIELEVKVQLAEKHHAYVKQFKISSQNNNDISVKPLIIKPTVNFYDHLAKKNKLGIENKATIKTSFEIPSSLASGEQLLKMELQYQACTKEYCLLPIKVPFELPLFIKGSSTPALSLTKNSFSVKSLDLSGQTTSLIFILFVLFGAGVLTSFTPCIYPMIPITLAVLGSSKNEQSFYKRLFLSLSYVFGIASTYSLLGVLAATSGDIFGSYAAHPLVTIGVSILFALMALSMFGLFELQAPVFLRNKFAGKQFKKNYIGAFLTGAVAGVIASPCVGPVLVVVLAYISTSQDIALGFLYMFTFSMGLGFLFIVLGIFSQALNALPKSGAWMNITKYIFGNIMLGMSLYYLAPQLTLSILYIFIILAISLSYYYCLKLVAFKNLKRVLSLFLFLGFIFAALGISPSGQKVINNFLKNKNSSAPHWNNYSEKLIKQAQAQGKGVIIDFYADWCAACHELEEKTFNQPKVHELGKQFIWIKYDATDTNDEFESLKKKYEIYGLPHIVIYNQKGAYLKELTLTGFEDEVSFAKRLQKALGTK